MKIGGSGLAEILIRHNSKWVFVIMGAMTYIFICGYMNSLECCILYILCRHDKLFCKILQKCMSSRWPQLQAVHPRNLEQRIKAPAVPRARVVTDVSYKVTRKLDGFQKILLRTYPFIVLEGKARLQCHFLPMDFS